MRFYLQLFWSGLIGLFVIATKLLAIVRAVFMKLEKNRLIS
ncbi:hypothetical protein Sez_0131 [Streptococcus equi subsp. zooepidemicus MGCS10565]|uniref:Uncharacterized protein n=1 Tax=Streptococcus equi subsp. zooepidemicus (strain MGCS10565) TaxID=552526 RepID=B4U068_STREM|nr:hypothetical protein Sez_0131 [Streptococcus equi subsp. zooepidemicus MGCS10565]